MSIDGNQQEKQINNNEKKSQSEYFVRMQALRMWFIELMEIKINKSAILKLLNMYLLIRRVVE